MIQKIKVWLYIPHHLIMQILLHVAVCTDLTPAGCNIQIIHHFPSFFHSRLAHEDQGFEMISSARKSGARTFKLTLSSSAGKKKKKKKKQQPASHFKLNLRDLFTSYRVSEVDNEGNIPDWMRKGAVKCWGKIKA